MVGNVATVSMSTDVLRKKQELTPHHRTTINSMYVQDTSWVVRACGIIGAALGNGQTCRWRIIGNRRKSGLWGKSAYGGPKNTTASIFFVHSVTKGYHERMVSGGSRYWTRVGHGQHILWLQFSLTNHCVWENDVRSAKNYP